MTRARPENLLKRKLLALSVAACFALNAGPLRANPTGPTVMSGGVGFGGLGTSALTITNQAGGNAIINWNGFSIGINELTRFQQFANLAVLNRVTGSELSSILGSLQSDGRIFLINPNGIVFGASARIDVAGMVASSLSFSDQDFLAGRLHFTEVPGAGAVVNNGVIETAAGGRVYLVAPTVENNGLIQSPQGAIVLAAGKEVELVDAASPFVTVKVAAAEQAVNVGTLVADGGQIGMFGALVRNSGVVEASSAVVGPGGEIRLVAAKDLTLDAGSVVAANGTSGGKVLLQAEGGTNLVGGTVEARGSSGRGGEVSALGVRVGVVGHGVIDASGDSGGGTVRVGGDYQGKNADVQNAERTYIGADGVIRADAMTTGDGGRVVVWADGDTQFRGSISARGGSKSGNGGFVETSGKGMLSVAGGRVDTRAPKGLAGGWLLDPPNYDINAVEAAAIEDSFASNGNIDIFADADINFQSSLNLAYGAFAGSFAAYAGNNINFNTFDIAGGGSFGANVNLAANSGLAYGGASGVGAITSSSGGGNITTLGGSLSASGVAVTLGNINTGASGLVDTPGGGGVTITASDGAIATGSITTGGGYVDLNANGAYGSVNVGGAINTSNLYGYLGDSSNGYVYISAAGDITTSSMTTVSLHPGHYNGGDVTLETSAGKILVTGNIDARGASGDAVDSQYYGGTPGGTVILDRFAQDAFTGTAVRVTGNILTKGGNGTSASSAVFDDHTGGYGGNVIIGSFVSECGAPGCDPIAGGVVVSGAVDASGGGGGTTDNAFASTYGGAGGQISVWASQDVAIGSLAARGGSAGGGSDGDYGGNFGGLGGVIDVSAGGAATISSINVSGGDGADGGGTVSGNSYGGNGGSAGVVSVQGSSISIESIMATGGNAGSGSTGGGYYESSGGSGGSGGGVQLYSIAGAVTVGSIDGSGGSGGAGGAASDYASGGNGGNAAGGLLGLQKGESLQTELALVNPDAVTLGRGITIVGSSINVGAITARGGNGGVGGSVSTGNAYSDGGSGGDGGSVQLWTTSDGRTQGTGPIVTGVIDVSGGTGADSGAIGTSDTYGGDGGEGGGISIYGSSVSTGKFIARGGNGGAVINTSMTSPNGTEIPYGGWGGYGGTVYVYATGEAKINVNGTLGAVAIDVAGGAGGKGGDANSPAGDGGGGGSGGTVGILGTPNMTLFGSVVAAGGAGGAGGAGNALNLGGAGGSGGEGGFISLDASSITGSRVGDGIIFVLAGTQFNVQGGLGGSGGGGGGMAGISGASQTFVKLADYFGTIVILDPLSIPEVNQAVQQTSGDKSTTIVGGEKEEEEEDKSQKELGSCKG